MARKLTDIADDAEKAAILAMRRAAAGVMTGLAEAGPYWGGDFRNSWYATSPNGTAAVRDGQDDGRYNLFNIPRFTPQDLRDGKMEIFIGNFSPYAQEAMDLIPGIFTYAGEPKGEVVATGTRRDSGIRGDIGPRKSRGSRNRSTAPLDWYRAHMAAGQFDRDFSRGARLGFLEAN